MKYAKTVVIGAILLAAVALSLVYEQNVKVEYGTSNNNITTELIELDLSLEQIRNSIANQILIDNMHKKRIVQTLYHECRECSLEENLMIMEVIATRWYVSYRKAQSPTDVIEQRKQFSYLNDVKSRERTAAPVEPKDVIALELLTKLVEDNFSAMVHEEMDSGLLMYYNPLKVDKTPSWVDPKCLVNTGNTLHKFYTCYKLK